jgi:hypothetical protein
MANGTRVTNAYVYMRWFMEERVREGDLEIVPTYTTCNAPQYPMLLLPQYPMLLARCCTERKQGRMGRKIRNGHDRQLGHKSKLVHLMPQQKLLSPTCVSTHVRLN